MPANNPLPALPQLVHDEVGREIARMNTAICQATQNSPIKVSLTWRPNPRFAQQLAQQVMQCIDGDTLAAPPAAPNLPPDTKSIIHLGRYVNETIDRLERTLAAFKAAASEIG